MHDTAAAIPAGLRPRRPPGPAGLPIIGNMRDLKHNLLGFLEASMHEYGELFHVPAGPYHFYLVGSPEYARHVLINNAANYTKGRMFSKLKGIIGEGLFTAEGELWRSQRRLMQPHFHNTVIRGIGELMTGIIDSAICRWRPMAERGEIVDFLPEMGRMTVDVVTAALFSDDVDADARAIGESLAVVLEHTHERFYALIDTTNMLPSKANRRYHKAVATLQSIVTRIIQERRSGIGTKPDLLQLLVDARDPDTGAAMDDQQLRDEVMTLFLAGHETTASVLAWTWYLLAANPVVDRVLRAEIAAVLGDRRPTVDDVPNLRYARQVFEEALRLYPPVHGIPRDPINEDVIGGYRIPAGSTVTISTYLIHRNPRLWDDPDGFDPDRFGPGQPQRHPFAYIPFGAGGRRCLGGAFAMMEGTLAITMIAQALRPTLVPGLPVLPDPRTTFRPASVPVRLRQVRAHPQPQPQVEEQAAT